MKRASDLVFILLALAWLYVIADGILGLMGGLR